MLYRLGQFILRDFEGKLIPLGVMCFNWMGRKHFIFMNFFMLAKFLYGFVHAIRLCTHAIRLFSRK